MGTEKNKYLHANHRSRMRERFSVRGFDGYHPHEVLEQLLFEAIPRVNTNETAHLLLNEFGSLENVLRASAKDLKKVHGIGEVAAEYIASRLGVVEGLILSQYNGLKDLSRYQIAFLADWFMRKSESGVFGVIVCGHEGDFKSFDFVFDEDEFAEMPAEIESDTICAIAERISEKVGDGTYYLIMRDIVLERSDLFRLLDETRMLGSVMLDAYELVGKEPKSVIYPN